MDETILAALRFWQRVGIMQDLPEDDIATNDGEFPALDPYDIDDLCEALNCCGDNWAA